MPPARDHVPWQATAALVAAALLLRVVAVLEISAAPPGQVLIGDAASYDEWARTLVEESWFWHADRVFYQAPLYPYLMGVVYALIGHSPFAVRLLQALLGGLTCWLVMRVAARHWGRRAALVAGALAAISPALVFFCAVIQKATLALFLTALLLDAASLACIRSRARDFALLGLAGGLLMLVRENAAALMLPAWLWLAWRGPAPLGRRLAHVALSLGVFVLALAPVAARNYAVDGGLHLSTSQAGPNFYIGNHAEATGLYTPLVPGHGNWHFERIDAFRIAEERSGRSLTAGEVSAFWLGESFRFIREQPRAWLLLQGKKLVHLLRSLESPDTETLYGYADFSWVLWVVQWLLPFGLVLALAAAAPALGALRGPGLTLTLGGAAIYAASLLAFYVTSRYRAPLGVLLLPPAAAFLAALPTHWPLRVGVLARLAPAALLALVSFAPWSAVSSVFPGRDVQRALTFANLAAPLDDAGLYERALAITPTNATAWLELGRVLAAEGKLERAERSLRRAVYLRPRHRVSWLRLGALQLHRGKAAEAQLSFRRALALAPDDDEAREGLRAAQRAMRSPG